MMIHVSATPNTVHVERCSALAGKGKPILCTCLLAPPHFFTIRDGLTLACIKSQLACIKSQLDALSRSLMRQHYDSPQLHFPTLSLSPWILWNTLCVIYPFAHFRGFTRCHCFSVLHSPLPTHSHDFFTTGPIFLWVEGLRYGHYSLQTPNNLPVPTYQCDLCVCVLCMPKCSTQMAQRAACRSIVLTPLFDA